MCRFLADFTLYIPQYWNTLCVSTNLSNMKENDTTHERYLTLVVYIYAVQSQTSNLANRQAGMLR